MPFLAEKHVSVPDKDILSWTFDDLSYNEDEPIYIDALNPDNYITARKARTLIRQLAAGFRAIGVQKGDAICMHSLNDIYYPIFFMGVLAAGGVFTATNPAYTPYELTHALKSANVKYVLVQPAFLDPILAATKESSIPKEHILIFNPNGEPVQIGFLTWPDLLQHGEQDWVPFDNERISSNTTAALLFSSGTTGLPKAAMLSHRNLIAQHTLLTAFENIPYKAIRLFGLPMFHAATLPSAFCTPLRSGERAYVLPRFDLEQWFRCIETFGVTNILIVPPVVIGAINSPLALKYSLKSIRHASCGAAPLDPRPQARMQALMTNGPFAQGWGMTESSCICAAFAFGERDVTGSVGRMLPGIDVKIVDESGNDITDYDVHGELCLRGPTVIRGYFENAEANARDWDADRYFHTGDVGYRARESKLWYLVDRKKELIKVRGFQVAPAEIEGVLLSHAGIVDAAVIGVPSITGAGADEATEVPRAYVVRRAGGGGGGPSEPEVKDYVRDRLVYYKQLAGGVVFLDAIQKTASGKILKRLLREQAKREMGAKL